MRATIRSFGHAIQGIRHCSKKERNFRTQIVCAVLVVAGGIFFQLATLEWCVILLCIALVLSLEMINTGIEHLCNILHKEYHPGIRIIKDVSAGAVLLSAVVSAICATLIFFPRIISIFSLIKKP